MLWKLDVPLVDWEDLPDWLLLGLVLVLFNFPTQVLQVLIAEVARVSRAALLDIVMLEGRVWIGVIDDLEATPFINVDVTFLTFKAIGVGV